VREPSVQTLALLQPARKHSILLESDLYLVAGIPRTWSVPLAFPGAHAIHKAARSPASLTCRPADLQTEKLLHLADPVQHRLSVKVHYVRGALPGALVPEER
jgi:hypothetical protein